MSIEVAEDLLLWCTIINYGLLMYWAAIFVLAHDRYHRLLGRWFHLSREQFDGFNAIGMTIYKLGIILLNLVPYVALRIVA